MILDNYNLLPEHYEAIYEKYLSRAPDELLLAPGSVKGKKVLDLCAGTLIVSRRAKELGASRVVAIDKSARMNHNRKEWADAVIITPVEMIDNHLLNGEFDLVVCRQGINYWFNEINVSRVVKKIKRGGHLVFNTFNRRPSEEPTIRQYDDFTEAIQLVDNEVYHLQMRKGYVPHFTSFKWIPSDDFENILTTHFKNVVSTIDGPTTVYSCER